ncbi:MAG: Wzz/FepE/Etk N-terminal domain-containing protein [Lachnospiraceae bacterium]|nr:Wzz/FepE/Etk N-terminal domain-containing protein [Lachnospiraceae bacterium]
MNEQTIQTQPEAGAANITRANRIADATTIDLVEVFQVIWHWLWLIVLVALACGTAAYAFSKFVLPEEFESTTKIYVLDKSGAGGTNSQSTYSDLQVGMQLTKDYVELIKSRTVLEAVMKDNHLDQTYTYEQFAETVNVQTPADTRIVTITVTNHDPALAQKLADDIRKRSGELIINTMQIDAVNTYEKANYPDRKSAPSCGRWAVVAALIGALAVSAIVIVRYLLDDTIKTSDDVEKYLGLSNLAMIPFDESVMTEDEDSSKGLRHGKFRKKSSGN